MQKHLDIVCMGMALVDSIIKGFDPEPISASGYRARSGSLNVGGEAVNEAVAASRLGMKTGIVCSLGEDPAGDMVLAQLERCGVDTSAVLRSEEHPTPVTTMFVRDDGTRKSITNGSHRYNFHPERYPEKFTCARALILGSLFRAPFDDPKIILSVVKAASEAGTLIFGDTKLPNFKKLSLDDIKEALPYLDFITPNEDEAKYFTGKEDPEEMADVFLSYGVKNVVVKLGAKGCFFKNKEMALTLPAFPIEAVDATGAGDCFVAGLATEILNHSGATSEIPNSSALTSGILDDAELQKALHFASACGAICTTAVGAGTALKSRDQVRKFLGKKP